MAKINFYRIEITDAETGEIKKEDIGNLLKNYIDQMEDSERFCKGGRCSAILSNYKVNDENKEFNIPSNITFDFSKFTNKKVNSAIIGAPLEDTDTFTELNHKTIDSVIYDMNTSELVRKSIIKDKSFDEIIDELRKLNISPYVVFKIIKDKKIKLQNSDGSLDFEKYYYDNVLNRLQKDKTYFNFVKINDINILSVLYNPDGFDEKKILEYLNMHLLIRKGFKLIKYNIYEDNFSDILDHSEMKTFEFTYKSTEKSILDKDEFNNVFETISDLAGLEGKHQVKISVDADKDYTLSNDKILTLFSLLKESGLMKTCKVKKKGSRKFVDSTSVGDLLTYTNTWKFDNLSNSNIIFQDAYNKKFITILDRIA